MCAELLSAGAVPLRIHGQSPIELQRSCQPQSRAFPPPTEVGGFHRAEVSMKFERHGVPTAVLDVHEAAAYLGVSEVTLYRLVRRREVPYTRVGRSIRFRVEELERYLEERTVRPGCEGENVNE